MNSKKDCNAIPNISDSRNTDLVDRISELVDFTNQVIEEPSDENKIIFMSHSRKLVLDRTKNSFIITSNEGNVELQVRITPEGPILVFNQSNIEISNTGNLDIRCKDLHIQTTGEMQFESGSGFNQIVSGNYALDVRDDTNLNAQSFKIKAELGELSLIANDDITMNGLRVLMNVPTEKELEERKDNLRTFQDYLNLPFVENNGPKRLPESQPKNRKDWKKS